MQSAGPPGLGLLSRWPRAENVERSVAFLQQQHSETLAQLHQEVERLKRQNQDLQYKLIMQPALHNPVSSPGVPPAKYRKSSTVEKVALSPRAAEKEGSGKPEVRKHVSEGLKDKVEDAEEAAVSVMQKETEALSLDQEMPAEMAPRSGHSMPLEQPARTSGHSMPLVQPARTREPEVCDRMTSPISFPSSSQTKTGEMKIPAASSNPFLVNVLPSCMRKPPTLEECEVVIRQLWNINHMQMQELMYLRSCLEDIHKTKRIPEDYMLAGHLGNQETTRLPRVKNAPKKCRILTPLPAAERAVLPALKQTLGNAFAERQKRAQAAQRNRLHRTVL